MCNIFAEEINFYIYNGISQFHVLKTTIILLHAVKEKRLKRCTFLASSPLWLILVHCMISCFPVRFEHNVHGRCLLVVVRCLLV